MTENMTLTRKPRGPARAFEIGEDGMPKHLRMGLTATGQGPADNQPEFDHWGCWCADPKCRLWRWTQRRPTRAFTLRIGFWGDDDELDGPGGLPGQLGFGIGVGPGRTLWFRTVRRRWRILL
jgi:hypothetical protein